MKLIKRIMGQQSSSNSKQQIRNASPAPQANKGISNKVALGGGCFWGVEKYVRRDFQKLFPNSIQSATVGFMSPKTSKRIENPTYEQVCTGQSGHVEVLMVELKEPEKHFEELIRFFFQFHDPTTKNRQGNDTGFQYASFIFCGDDEQYKIAEKVRDEVQGFLDEKAIAGAYQNNKVTTLVSPLSKFTPADESHQRYLEKHPNGYCNHRIRFKQWPEVVNNNAKENDLPESQKDWSIEA